MVTLVEITLIRAPIDRCFDLARDIETHLAGNVHWGEQALLSGGAATGLIELGQRVTWRARHFWVWHTLTSEITAMERPTYFQDVMLAGPFASMRHDHSFRALASGVTEMKDVFMFRAPLGLLGRVAEYAVLRRHMRSLLRERNLVIQQRAEELP